MDRCEPKIAQIGRPERLLYSWRSRCCTECFTDVTDKSVKSYHLLGLDSTNKCYFFVRKPGFTFMLMPLIVECDFVVVFKVKLSTPATLIPEALKTFSLKVDILDFNHKYSMLRSGN